MLTYLSELATEYQTLGEGQFVKQHGPRCVMIGVGVLGMLKDEGQTPNTTFKFTPEEEARYLQSAALVDRVWFVQKRDGGHRSEPLITVGRTSETDITIPEYSLSRRHCAFEATGMGYRILDLGSKNGTRINGQLLRQGESVWVRSGNRLVLGRFEFEFLESKQFLQKLAVVGAKLPKAPAKPAR